MKKSLIPLIILFTLTGCAELVPALPAIAAYAAGAYTVADTEVLYKETKERLKGGTPALEVAQDDGDVGSSNGSVLFCPLTLVQIGISKNLFNQGYVILSKLSPTL